MPIGQLPRQQEHGMAVGEQYGKFHGLIRSRGVAGYEAGVGIVSASQDAIIAVHYSQTLYSFFEAMRHAEIKAVAAAGKDAREAEQPTRSLFLRLLAKRSASPESSMRSIRRTSA